VCVCVCVLCVVCTSVWSVRSMSVRKSRWRSSSLRADRMDGASKRKEKNSSTWRASSDFSGICREKNNNKKE
jgi:hypothetical protein